MSTFFFFKSYSGRFLWSLSGLLKLESAHCDIGLEILLITPLLVRASTALSHKRVLL